MALEIERKFLVKSLSFKENSHRELLVQGYLHRSKEKTIRIRINNNSAKLNIKGQTFGIVRNEFEYEIPINDATELISLCDKPIIEKYRYTLDYKGFTWEVDEFCGDNKGLIIAEIELYEENESFEKPDWLGKEVTGDIRYYNSQLSRVPYKNWSI